LNIVVTSPKDADLSHKLDDVENSFWSLAHQPKNFKVGEIIWIVKDGHVVGGFYVKTIEKIDSALEDAEGHNPCKGYRFWFEAEVDDYTLVDFGVLDKNTLDLAIKCKGFQGFRYQWWAPKEVS